MTLLLPPQFDVLIVILSISYWNVKKEQVKERKERKSK